MAQSHKRPHRFLIVFFRRGRSGPDPLVRVRLATLVLGGVLGLVGMRFDNSLLVSVAIGVVLVGFALRFVPGSSVGDRKPGTGGREGGGS